MVLKEERKIFLPSDNEKKLIKKEVKYNKHSLIKTVNNISIKLGAHYTTSIGYKPFLKGRIVTIQEKQKFDSYYNTQGMVVRMIEKQKFPHYDTQETPAIYRCYYDEDEIIKAMLDLRQDILLLDDLGLKKSFGLTEPALHDNFNFYALDNFLEENSLNASRYLDVLREYLKEFEINEQEEYVSQDNFRQQYKTSILAEEAFLCQKMLAESNERILSLKKTV